eukprot:8754283-Prorocentrum_lima.AAC.1
MESRKSTAGVAAAAAAADNVTWEMPVVVLKKVRQAAKVGGGDEAAIRYPTRPELETQALAAKTRITFFHRR